MSPEPTADTSPELGRDRDDAGRRHDGLLFALGVALLALYGAFRWFFPRLPGEFSYVPALEPLPFAPMRGFTFEQLLAHLGRLGLLAPALLCLALALAGRVSPWRPEPARLRRLALLAGGVSVLLSALCLTQLLRGRPIVDDELTYRDQAMLLADGRLGETALPALGLEPFTIASRAGLTGKYLFGEPLVQIPGALVGLPGLAHLALAALALLAWFQVARAAAGEAAGAWATIALALSPMFVFTNGTGLSHTTSLACIAGAGLGLVWIDARRAMAGALLLGSCLGFACTVRPQVAVPVGAVLALAAARTLWRERRWAALAAASASAGVWVVAIAAYDVAVTGSAWRLPWSLFPSQERLGFGPPHSVLGAVANLLVSLVRWNGWWTGLPAGLLLLVVWEALGRPARGLRLWGLCGAALVGFNFLYFSPGVSDTGPVYYFELLLPGSLLVGNVVAAGLQRAPRLAAAAIAVHLALGTGSFLAEEGARLLRLRHAINDRVDAVLPRITTPALLFYETRASEKVSPGWVFSFPLRQRSERDSVVTYPRHSPEEVAAVRALWPGRRCYYFRVDPVSTAPELHACDAAGEMLSRPAAPELEGPGRMPLPTAARLGLLPYAAPAGESAAGGAGSRSSLEANQ